MLFFLSFSIFLLVEIFDILASGTTTTTAEDGKYPRIHLYGYIGKGNNNKNLRIINRQNPVDLSKLTRARGKASRRNKDKKKRETSQRARDEK